MLDSQENQIEIDVFTPYLRAYDRAPIHRITKKFNRNERCPYTDIKFKKCCGKDGKNFCPKLTKDYIDNL
jgi:hypothetical protein